MVVVVRLAGLTVLVLPKGNVLRFSFLCLSSLFWKYSCIQYGHVEACKGVYAVIKCGKVCKELIVQFIILQGTILIHRNP